jgi:Trk K+ transport system NAD-binding subunit
MTVVSRPRKRTSSWTARLLFAGYAVRLAAPRMLILVAITLGGGLYYQARVKAATKVSVDFTAACYQVYTQLFFEHAAPLPADSGLRFLFFFVPIVGVFVLAEGLFKLGGSLVDFRSHQEQWMRIMAKTYRDHTLLIGLGHVGFRVLEELLFRGVDVVVIEAKDGGPFVDEARAQGVPLVIGDARRASLLTELGVEHAAALIAATDNDLVNVEAALDARKVNPSIRVVMRMFDQDMAQKIGDAFSVDASFSTSAIAAPLFAAAALDQNILGAYRLGDTMMVSVEVPLPDGSALDGKTVTDIQTALKAPVIGVHRKGSSATHNFANTERLSPGDKVICHVPVDNVGTLRERLRG